MKIFLSLSLSFFTISCADSRYQPNFSNWELLQRIQGQYIGEYNNTSFEIWIEEAEIGSIDQSYSNPGSLFVMMFERYRYVEIEQLLQKYQDSQALLQDVCPYMIDRTGGVYSLWRAHNIGGLAMMFMTYDLSRTSSLPLDTLFYIDFPVNDEHAFVSLRVDNRGQAIEIKFLETGFFKKIWNYFLRPSMKIQKVSNVTPNLLTRFYISSQQVDEELARHHQNRTSSCQDIVIR